LQGSLEHGPQGRLMIDRVVCNENAARHYARHQCLITAFIDFLLGVEKAEGDVFAARKVIQSITVHKLDNITDTSRIEACRASSAFSSNISCVVIFLPTARQARASQSVEYPALVPISMQRPAGAAAATMAMN